ncbi:hypothetical protein Golob_024131, partial [Gossypium lobatum]|nr:hypothetical protein [Gossypium lobatum]
MQYKKLVNNVTCPQCGRGAETADYLIRDCPIDRNTRIHERKVNKRREIARFIVYYITEINETDRRNLTKEHEAVKWRGPSGYAIKINFDSAYDGRNC